VSSQQATLERPRSSTTWTPGVDPRGVAADEPHDAALGRTLAWMAWIVAIGVAAAADGIGAGIAAWVVYWPVLLAAAVGVAAIRDRRRRGVTV
jgi:hypothetical protein